MITLAYAKKIGDRYVMNFFADTEEDLENFDTKANFMYYGAPLAGSSITCSSGEQKNNYYIDKNGGLVKIKSGELPSGIGEYELNKIINAVIFDPTAKTPDEIDAVLDEIDFSDDDTIVLAHTTKEGSMGQLPGSIYAMEAEGVIGIQVFLENNGLIYLKQGMSLDPVEGGKWYEFDGEGVFTEITEKATFNLANNMTIDEVSEFFAPLNGTLFGCVEAEAAGYTEFREGQVISGIKFDTENGEEIINNIVNYISTYVGVNEDGYVEIAETTVGEVNQTAGWNGVILGKGDHMDAIAENDVLTEIKVADSMSKEDVVSVLEGLTYNNYMEGVDYCDLIRNSSRDNFVVVTREANDGGGYNYFITVDTDGPDYYQRNSVIIFASSPNYYDEKNDIFIDLGKDGWIDSYVSADDIEAELFYADHSMLFISSFPVSENKNGIVVVSHEDVDDADEDESYKFIWSSDDFDMEGRHVTKGWQNLTNGTFNFQYNHVIEEVNEMPGWNALLCGANEVSNATTYNITGNIINGKIIGKESDSEIITGGYAEVEIEANSGYILPDTVSVHAASHSYNSGTIYISNPTEDVFITATCPSSVTFTEFYNNQVISGIDFGDVQDGQTNDALDLKLLEDYDNDTPGDIIFVDCENSNIIVRSKFNGVGLLAEYRPGSQDVVVPIYATDSGEYPIEGGSSVSFTKGYQNITDGKYLFGKDLSVAFTSRSIQNWNGVLFGAVEASAPALTPFSVGQTITGVDFGNVVNGYIEENPAYDFSTLDTFLEGLSYMQGAVATLVAENNAGYGLHAYNLSAMTGGTVQGYALLYMDSGMEGEIIYSTAAVPGGEDMPAIVRGFQNLTNGKYIGTDTITVDIVNDAQGWNGTLIGAVTE